MLQWLPVRLTMSLLLVSLTMVALQVINLTMVALQVINLTMVALQVINLAMSEQLLAAMMTPALVVPMVMNLLHCPKTLGIKILLQKSMLYKT
jgi:hypothetical protein